MTNTGINHNITPSPERLDFLPPYAGDATIAQTLAAFSPVAFNVNFARITGCAKAALFLSQLMYWTRRGNDIVECDGWVYKTREQWFTEIGLGRHEQSSTRKILVDLGLIHADCIGHPARNCYRIIPDVLGLRLAQLMRTEPVQWSLLDIRNDAQHIRNLLGRQLAFHRVLVDITGSCTTAVYLSKALSIQRRIDNRRSSSPTTSTSAAALAWDKDWIRMAVPATQDETGLTPAQQRKARQELIDKGILHMAMLAYPRKQLYLSVDAFALQHALVAALNPVCQNPPMVGKQRQNETGVRLQHVAQNVAKPLQNSHEHPTACQNQPMDGKQRQNETGVRLQHVAQNVAKPLQNSHEHPAVCQNQPMNGSPDAKNDQSGDCFSQTSLPFLARPAAGFSTVSRPFLAHLHARDAMRAGETTRYDYKENTTTTTPPPNADADAKTDVVVVHSSNIFWPDEFSDWQKNQCTKVLEQLGSNDQNKQNLIDEMHAHMLGGTVKSPVAYLSKLVREHMKTPGGLVFERVDLIRERRLQQTQIKNIGQKNTVTTAPNQQPTWTPPSPEVLAKFRAARAKLASDIALKKSNGPQQK